MSPLRPPTFVLNPSWPHYAAVLVLGLATMSGLLRMIFFDWMDPMHCQTLLNKGSWLDEQWKNWQPDGCMLYPYTSKDAGTCLRSSNVVFVGDSVTRQLFYQFAHILDPELPMSPPNDDQKHADHTLQSSSEVEMTFYWDPFLNSSRTADILTSQNSTTIERRPALLVLGSGLWYLRYANDSGGISAWEANMAHYITYMDRQRSKPADLTVVLPVEQVNPTKLSPDRAATMHPSNIDAMNSDLYHRVHSVSNGYDGFWIDRPIPSIVLPRVFNDMLDESQTEDGLHFSAEVIRVQANVLLNLRCNNELPKVYPLNKTCCARYPIPPLIHIFVLLLAFALGPVICYRLSKTGIKFRDMATSLWTGNELPVLVLSVALAFIYVADRTGLWFKEQKQYDFWAFTFLSLGSLVCGLLTVKRGDKDLGFLNRDQTDEWKGWMQIAILIYHYFGASKISGIYNPIRVLVASYLFMTGYGHTTFYLRKADFSFARAAQIFFRLNFLTVLLAYTMDTDYMFYYFAPLVSMWYLIIYATLFLGSQYNERTAFLLGKIFISASLVTSFFKLEWPLEFLFQVLRDIFNIRWSAREWAFRVTLDLWIVYVGMLASFAVIKIREHRLTDHPKWPIAVKTGIALSAFTLVWFLAFELLQESKFTYNAWHPYISPLPVLAFMVLRNANVTLRSASSRAFAFIGKCSLETFIVQYHFWLAGDTKGVLLMIPGTKWRPVNFVLTSFVFVYLCHRIANATGELTKRVCAEQQSLPTTSMAGIHDRIPMSEARPVSNATGSVNGGASGARSALIPSTTTTAESGRKDINNGNSLPPEPDTPIRPTMRWVDRLAEGSRREAPSLHIPSWLWSLKAKTVVLLCVLWLVNMLWTYPE